MSTGPAPLPGTINQALAAVTLMHEQAGLRIAVMRARVPVRRPGRALVMVHGLHVTPAKAAARLIVGPLVISSVPPAVKGGDLAYGLSDGRGVPF